MKEKRKRKITVAAHFLRVCSVLWWHPVCDCTPQVPQVVQFKTASYSFYLPVSTAPPTPLCSWCKDEVADTVRPPLGLKSEFFLGWVRVH